MNSCTAAFTVNYLSKFCWHIHLPDNFCGPPSPTTGAGCASYVSGVHSLDVYTSLGMKSSYFMTCARGLPHPFAVDSSCWFAGDNWPTLYDQNGETKYPSRKQVWLESGDDHRPGLRLLSLGGPCVSHAGVSLQPVHQSAEMDFCC